MIGIGIALGTTLAMGAAPNGLNGLVGRPADLSQWAYARDILDGHSPPSFVEPHPNSEGRAGVQDASFAACMFRERNDDRRPVVRPM